MAYLKEETLREMGFRSLGSHVLISDKASIYRPDQIEIGDHVRIDDFCILSAGTGGIKIGSYIHVAAYTSLIGKETITLADFVNLSSRVSIYSSSDDYSGEFMTNPMVPATLTNVDHRSVTLGAHCIVGSGSVILPGVTLGEGCAIGALSLVRDACEPFMIYAGVPAKPIKPRNRHLLKLATTLGSDEK